MSNTKVSKEEKEKLEQLENEAFLELCQIIAIATQAQDIEYLNNMISIWKSKYKNLLDNPSPNFKKRIEFLLNQYYSKIVEFILSQIKFKEEKAIKNQRKALNKLYTIIKDNYDLDTLKSEIKKWEEKYPYDSFLSMYQKRIDAAKKEKNLEENAFRQEEAFRDLYYDVVNRSGTIEELKSYLKRWEQKYSINDRFTIDQFIKHQSEVKRYVSDDFLISIAKTPENILSNATTKVSESNLDAQAVAYNKLKAIIGMRNNLNEVFTWVYKNRNVKFDDRYKELILSATYAQYSPLLLKQLSIPDFDISKNYLPIEQYTNIDEIKRYAIISYFCLLYPANMITNNYFNTHIQTIYEKVQNMKVLKAEPENINLQNDIPVLESEQKIVDLQVNIDTGAKDIPGFTDILAIADSSSIDNTEETIQGIQTPAEVIPSVDTGFSEAPENDNAFEDTNSVIQEYQNSEVDIHSSNTEITESENTQINSEITDSPKELIKGKAEEAGSHTIESPPENSQVPVPYEQENDSSETNIKISKPSDSSKPEEIIQDIKESGTSELSAHTIPIEPLEPEETQKAIENAEENIIQQTKPSIETTKSHLSDDTIITKPTSSDQKLSDAMDIDNSNPDEASSSLDSDTIISIAPQFFEAIYNYNVQSVVFDDAKEKADMYVDMQKEPEVNLDLDIYKAKL